MLTSARDRALGIVKKFSHTIIPTACKGVGGCGEWDLCFRTANDRAMKLYREKTYSVRNQI